MIFKYIKNYIKLGIDNFVLLMYNIYRNGKEIKQMRKVYLLVNNVIDDYGVIDAFSSMKKAEERKAKLIENDKFYHNSPESLDIEIYEVK